MSKNIDDSGREDEKGRLDAVRDKARDTYRSARAKAGEQLDAARDKTSAAYESARGRTSAAYEGVRRRANETYEEARQRAAEARERTAKGINDSPEGALFGGLALGALLAFFLPRTRQERRALGPVGERINRTASDAARAAAEAGRQKLDEMGYNRENAKAKVGEVAESVKKAANSSANAAAKKVKERS
ncbi:MAG: hypothetical protein ACFBQW_04785 [Sphingomonadaceae bacterium]